MFQNILTGIIVQKNEPTTLTHTFFPSVKHIQCSQLRSEKSPVSAWAWFTHHCRIETTSPYPNCKFFHCDRPTLQYSPNCVIVLHVNYSLLGCDNV